jgi:hypothetical protein
MTICALWDTMWRNATWYPMAWRWLFTAETCSHYFNIKYKICCARLSYRHIKVCYFSLPCTASPISEIREGHETGNARLQGNRSVRVTIVAVKNQQLLQILSVCLYTCLFSMLSACAVLYCPLQPVCLYHIWQQYFLNVTIFGKKVIEHKMCFDVLHKLSLKYW